MAIRFDDNDELNYESSEELENEALSDITETEKPTQEVETQQIEVVNTETNSVKNDAQKYKKKKFKEGKTQLQHWSTVFLVLSIFAILYSASYLFTGLITFIPLLVLWLVWIVAVVGVTVFTIGLCWLSDSYKHFVSSFTDFNTNIGKFFEKITLFLYSALPVLGSLFAMSVITFLVLSIIGYKKQKKSGKKLGFTSKFVLSIIFTVIFVAFMIFDIIVIANGGLPITK